MRVAIALFLATAMAAHGQSAKVIQLKPEDSAQAKQLDADQKALDARRDKFHDHIIRDYLVTTDRQERCCDNIWTDPEDKKESLFTGTMSISAGLTLNGNRDDRCLTPGEVAAHKAAVAKQEAEEAAYAKAHPTKYYKDGWMSGFEYSEGFQYVVPADQKPPSNRMPFYGTQPCGITLVGH